MRAQINLVCKRLPQGYSSPFKITTARNFSRQTNKQLQLHCKQFHICNWFPDGLKKPNTIFLFKCFLRDHRHEVFIQRYTKWLVPREMANLIFLESHVSRGEARCWEEISSCKTIQNVWNSNGTTSRTRNVLLQSFEHSDVLNFYDIFEFICKIISDLASEGLEKRVNRSCNVRVATIWE